ncbi:MAG TPA: DUF3372 domain-containing protein, partial [Chloroflexota bacterium]|nr:DUF3372 domain-containing protein [Chloroflexota bacterium]
YNSGDWFNRLDFTYETNNWGVGLPVASKNQENWPLQQPLLADPSLVVDSELIRQTADHFQTMLQVRRSSPLFRLQTADEIMARLQFHNTGPAQIPGLIVMSLSDQVGADLDPQFDQTVVLFNANDEAQTFTMGELAGMEMVLHPVLAASSDGRYAEMSYDASSGTFAVPGRSTAVFVLPESGVEEAAVEEAVVEGAATAVSEAVVVETAVTPEPALLTPTPAPTASSEESGLPSWLGIAGIGVVVVLILAFIGLRRRR